MRVLIVNAFSNSVQGWRSYQIFRNSVRQAFTFQKMFNINDIQIVEVDRHSIDNYLYQTMSGFQSKDAQKLFDHLDFVFIDGDANLLPWLKHAKKFLILIRMCKATRKILFACTFAMQALVYICATNFNIDRVLNGQGKGTPLKHFQKQSSQKLKFMRPGDVFLDSVTGDIFCWDSHKNQLYPIANTGIHNNKDAQDYEFSKTMLKTSTYFAKAVDRTDHVFIGKTNEIKCRVYKQYLQHWLTKSTGFGQFLVPNMNKWDVHPINATVKQNVLSVLAQSNRGPQVIIHQNAVGVQFHINPKYPATFTVLKNFVVHMMSRFQSESDKFDIPLQSTFKYNLGSKQGLVSRSKFIIGNDGTPMLVQKTQKTLKGFKPNQAKHSGFAFSLRGGEPVTVQINSTRASGVKIRGKKPNKVHVESYQAFSDSSEESATYIQRKNSPNKRRVGFVRKTTKIQTVKEKPQLETGVILPVQSDYLQNMGEAFLDGLPTAWKSKKEIRSLLHPGYPTHLIPKKGNLVHGQNLTLTKNDFDFYEKPLVKVVTSRSPYCRFKKQQPFLISKKSEFYNTIELPYLQPEKQKRKELIQSKKKWVSSRDFQVSKPKQSLLSATGYNSNSQPLERYKFRDQTRKKWLAGPFKATSFAQMGFLNN